MFFMHDLVVFHQDIADVFSFYKTNVISCFFKKGSLKHLWFLHMYRAESGSVFDFPSRRGEE